MTPALIVAIASIAQTTPPPPPVQRQVEAMKQVTITDCKELVDKLESFGTRHTLSQTDSPTRGIGAARNWIKAELDKYAAASGESSTVEPRLKVEFEEFDAPKGPRLPEGGRIVNVVATLPGTMKEAADRRYYVVGHYDSRNGQPLDAAGDAPGANDNASGTAVVMACARALAARQFDSTLVFLLTAGEEQGLIGANYHVSQAVGRGENIAGVLNNDIVGDPSDPETPGSKVWIVRIFSEGLPRNPSAEAIARLRMMSSESDSSSRQLARYVDQLASQHEGAVPMVSMVYRQDRFLRGGDHIAFNDAGFAAVRFTVARETYLRQHVDVKTINNTREGDVGRYVNGEYLAAVTKLNISALINLANAPRPPADVRVVTAELGNETVLRWSPSPEPDVVGYEVVYRQTSDAQWSDAAFQTGRVTEYKLKLSKDDHFFGVRACDRDGYRSPVAFAGAAKE